MDEHDKERVLRIADNLEKTNAEDLVLIAKYSNNKKRLQRVQVFISSTIATMAGAAIVATYLFPDLDKILITACSLVLGVLTVALSFWERKKEEEALLSRLLKESKNPSIDDIKEAEAFRNEMIKALKKEDK